LALCAVACEVSDSNDDGDQESSGGRPGSSEGGAPNSPDDDHDRPDDSHDAGAGGGDAGAAGAAGAAGSPGNVPDSDAGEGAGGNAGDPNEGPGPRFFLPTPEPTNTAAPTVEIDSKGGIHAVYPRYTIGGAFYAYCASDCSASDAMSVVELDTVGTVHDAMLALDSKGRPRVLLSTANSVYYASCDADCDAASAWEISQILDHDGAREVTGEAFALDPEGRPRFLMHTYRALFGLGQQPRRTFLVSCDADCLESASWRTSQIATQTWEGTHLRYDSAGRAHAATVANVEENGVVTRKLGAYALCEGDCDVDTNWQGTGLYEAFEHTTAAVAMQPTIAMALTRAGNPRVAVLGKNAQGGRNIVYFECDQNCRGDGWAGSVISENGEIDAGLDLALDRDERPRLAFTLGFNIGLYHCDDLEDCTSENAPWDLTKVELGSDMPTDSIFLWDNCTIGAWFLHDPSIALGPDGAPRVAYQARDISGGSSQPDPTRPRCVAGTDMTWSRLAVMSSHE
jgi:hypothetical protein